MIEEMEPTQAAPEETAAPVVEAEVSAEAPIAVSAEEPAAAAAEEPAPEAAAIVEEAVAPPAEESTPVQPAEPAEAAVEPEPAPVPPAPQVAAPEPEVKPEGRNRRKVRQGRVVSNKMDKTVVVGIERLLRHPLYGKTVRRTRHFKAHDAQNECSIGDMVEIMETRPISKEKRWRVVRIVEKVK
jgi:small subunit ribosomal protein S17